MFLRVLQNICKGRKATLLVAFCFTFVFNSLGQYGKQTNYWPLADSTALDFSTNPPLLVNSGLEIHSIPSSMSDYEGNLLFYTDGRVVKNSQHQTMENGFLINNITDLEYNSLIVPKPYNDSLYYIFTIKYGGLPEPILTYSVVNIRENGGLGKVTKVSTKLLDSLTSKLSGLVSYADSSIYIATRHENSFLSFLRINEDSLTKVPINIAINNLDTITSPYDVAQLELSSSGNRMFLGHSFQHNDSTIGYLLERKSGVFPVQNKFILEKKFSNSLYPAVFGIKYSPNSKNIYYLDENNYTPKQYYFLKGRTDFHDSSYFHSSLELFDSIDISSVVVGVDTFDGQSPIMQYTPYGSIMVIHPRVKIVGSGYESYLDEIVSPNNYSNPDYRKKTITVNEDLDFLPNFLPSYFDTSHFYPCDTFQVVNTCLNETTEFLAPYCDSLARYEWHFGDGNVSDSLNKSTERNPQHIYTQNGAYEVNLTIRTILYTRYLKDTIFISTRITDTTNIGKDTSICEGSSVSYEIKNQTSVPHDFLWMDSASSKIASFNEHGVVWGQVYNSCNYQRDSIFLTVHDSIRNPFPADTFLCGDDQIELDAKNERALYHSWYLNDDWYDTNRVVTIFESGLYSVTILNECFARTSYINVYFERENSGFTNANIFTPNGDGVNDNLVLYESNAKDAQILIYNRWGRNVFDSKDPNPIDGYKGNHWRAFNVPQGMYFYKVSFTNCKGEKIERKGTVFLSR